METKEIQVRIDNFIKKFADEMWGEKLKTEDDILKFFLQRIAVVSIQLEIEKERQSLFVAASEEVVRIGEDREFLEEYEIDSIVSAAKTALAQLEKKKT